MKEAAKLNFQFGAGTTSDKIDEFVEKGSTSVFSYLVSPDLQKARLVNLGTMSDAPDDISKILRGTVGTVLRAGRRSGCC